jgi:Cu(I)/Ag(I) efflux system membrane protein CusA/SilA
VQTGMVMVIYLNDAVQRMRLDTGKLTTDALKEAVISGAVLRLRPKSCVSTVVAVSRSCGQQRQAG